MSAKYISLALLLCVGHLVFGSSIAEEKESALKRIDVQKKAIRDAFKNMSDFYMKGPSHIDSITQQKMELGQSLRELNTYEVNKIAEGSKQKAKLLSSPSKVLDCIDARKEKAVSGVETAFAKGIVQAVGDLKEKFKNKLHSMTREWYDGYYKNLEVFFLQTDRTQAEIKITNSKAYVVSLMDHFNKVANETLSHVFSLRTSFARSDAQFDRNLEKGPVTTYRNTGRRIVDQLQEAVNHCFLVI